MAKTLKANSRFRCLRSVAVWPLIAGYLALVVAFAWDPTSFAQVLAAIGIASAMAHAVLYYGWKDACIGLHRPERVSRVSTWTRFLSIL